VRLVYGHGSYDEPYLVFAYYNVWIWYVVDVHVDLEKLVDDEGRRVPTADMPFIK